MARRTALGVLSVPPAMAHVTACVFLLDIAVVRYALPSKVSLWRDLKDLEVDGVRVVIANATVPQRTQREKRA